MRKALLSGLRIGVPLALAVALVAYLYGQLDRTQRAELFTAFRAADGWWLLLSVFMGWLSHVVRAWRWRLLLVPLGHRVRLWPSYHATMVGYFMNLLLPRAGEASRAVVLSRTSGVPFGQGFGTVIAERVVDTLMLGGIALATLALQVDMLPLLRARYAAFKQRLPTASGTGPDGWWPLIASALVVALFAGLFLVASQPRLRRRVRDGLRGLVQGMRTVLDTPHRLAFLFHTTLIWALYVAMFWVGFFALPATAAVPFPGVMAAFLAGSLGIILVQGGIGVYPLFVGLITSVYMPDGARADGAHPEAIAMGWLLWAAQTVMLVALGGLSLLLARRRKQPTARPAHHHPAT